MTTETVLLLLVIGFALNWATTGEAAVGANLSGPAGYIGLNVSVRADGRTAHALARPS